MDSVLFEAVSLLERKVFSLPKLLLLLGMLQAHPWLVVVVLPEVLLSDVAQSKVVATLTNVIEATNRDIVQLNTMRTRAEEHDLRHADALR